MSRLRHRIPLTRGALLLFLLTSACAPPPAKSELVAAASAADGAAIAGSAIPVGADDPRRGNVDAPVTVVVFGDYDCPHCRRANRLLAELVEVYGPNKLRVVWKHFPLDSDSAARTAAELSIGVRSLGGDAAFWSFHDAVYGSPDDGGTERRVALALVDARTKGHLDLEALARSAQTEGRLKVEADIALGHSLGVRALPTVFINGIGLEGIGSRDDVTAIVDRELAMGAELTLQKVPAGAVYERRVAENMAQRPAPKLAPEDDADLEDFEPLDDTIFRVPIAGSPVLGPPDAPVTLVVFADFECGFCSGAAATILELRAKYGDKLRYVFKNNPLPFHDLAEPAAQLALEIRQQKGDAAFFRAHDALFSAKGALDKQLFERVAREAEIPFADAEAAMRDRRHTRRIEDDQLLADDLGATGTPYFFLNGKQIKGARKIGFFTRVIDRELANADAMIKSGIAPDALYASIIERGKAPTPLKAVDVPPPSKAAPARGPSDAPVLVQVFADFQCGYCRIHAKRMEDLERAFPDKLRFVFHNRPLEGHPRAVPAAVAALEARRQKGDEAFFKMHDLLFADPKGLDDAGLLDKASQLGLDVKRFETELKSNRFDKALAADAELAEKLDVSGTPATFINGYRVSGAAPLVRFKKAVRQALADAATKRK